MTDLSQLSDADLTALYNQGDAGAAPPPVLRSHNGGVTIQLEQPAPAAAPAASVADAAPDLSAMSDDQLRALYAQSAPKPATPPMQPGVIPQITGFMANLNRGLGVGDEMAAGFKTAGHVLSGATPLDQIPADYTSSLAQQRDLEDSYNAAHPHMAALGRGVGMGLPMAATLGAAAPEAVGGALLGNIGRGSAAGGAWAYGYGLTDRGTATERVAAANRAVPLGLLLGGAGGAFAPQAKAPMLPDGDGATLADYTRADVDPMLAVNGSPSLQRVGQMLKGIPFVGGPLVAGADRTAAQLDTGVHNVASRLGLASDPLEAGTALQTGAQGAVDRYKAQIGELYKPVNTLEENPAAIPVTSTQAAIGEMFAKYPTIPDWLEKNAPALVRVRDTLANAKGQLTFGELKAMRGDIGKMIDDHLTIGNIDQARLKTLYGAMSDDLLHGAGQLGGASAQEALVRADTYNAAVRARLSDTLDKVIQARSPEDAYGKVLAMSGSTGRADLSTLSRLRRSLDPESWQNFSAGVIQRMGRDPSGSFSPAAFATAYRKMTPQGRAALFGEQTADMDALYRIANTQTRAGKFYNHSNSSNHAIGAMLLFEPVQQAIEHAMTGHFTGAVGAVVGPALGGLGGNGAARLLASPGFARRVLAQGSAAQAQAAIEAYAANNPSVAALARSFGRQLRQGLSQGGPGVAASIPSQQSR